MVSAALEASTPARAVEAERLLWVRERTGAGRSKNEKHVPKAAEGGKVAHKALEAVGWVNRRHGEFLLRAADTQITRGYFSAVSVLAAFEGLLAFITMRRVGRDPAGCVSRSFEEARRPEFGLLDPSPSTYDLLADD